MEEPLASARLEVETALSILRFNFAEWAVRDFPLHGADCLRIMGNLGLCDQAQADEAMAAAEREYQIEQATNGSGSNAS